MSDLKTPAVVINFKAYAEVEGLKAVELAKICESVAKSSGVSIGVCPPVAELGAVARSVSIPSSPRTSTRTNPVPLPVG